MRSLDFTQKQLSTNFQKLDLAKLEIKNINGNSMAETNKFDAMVVFNPDENYYYIGYYGFRFLYENFHKSKMCRRLIKWLLPVFNFFGPRIYAVIARNRKVAGCNSNSCNMHSKRNEI